MGQYAIRPLDTETWDAYARLMDKHNGAGFGCWCTWFHQRRKDRGIDAEIDAGRPYKEWLVQRGEAHAAVVFEDELAVGWAQFGPPAELPNIHHRKDYEAGLESPPDYRVTCIFVDRNHRRDGVAAVALGGALDLIARPAAESSRATRRTRRERRSNPPSSTTPPAACTRRRASPTSAPRARTTA